MSRPTCCTGNCNQGRTCVARPPRSAAPSRLAGKVLLGAVVMLTVLAMAACSKEAAARFDNVITTDDPMRLLRSDVHVFMDPVTGCHYLAFEDTRTSLVPRIAADGRTHLGCKEAK